MPLRFFRQKANDAPKRLRVRGLEKFNRAVPGAAVREDEEVLHLDFERLGELHEGGNRRAPLPAQNLREALGEVGLQVEPVEGSVLPMDELPQPFRKSCSRPTARGG